MSAGRPGPGRRSFRHKVYETILLIDPVILLVSCTSVIRSKIISKQQPLTENDVVLVFREDEPFDGEGIEIGTVKAGDSGFSSNCSYNEVIEKLLQMARSNGANIIKITERVPPDHWSTCDRISAKIYRVPEFRKYEKEIIWSPGRKLIWDDFKGTPVLYSKDNIAAATNCTFSFESNRVTMFKKVKIYTKTAFDCTLSWVRPDQIGRVDLLEHEQTHFDLCEVYARMLRKRIEEQKVTAFNLYEANIVFKEVSELYSDRQELYDKETNHGLSREKQIEWTAKVGKELNESSAYL